MVFAWSLGFSYSSLGRNFKIKSTVVVLYIWKQATHQSKQTYSCASIPDLHSFVSRSWDQEGARDSSLPLQTKRWMILQTCTKQMLANQWTFAYNINLRHVVLILTSFPTDSLIVWWAFAGAQAMHSTTWSWSFNSYLHSLLAITHIRIDWNKININQH